MQCARSGARPELLIRRTPDTVDYAVIIVDGYLTSERDRLEDQWQCGRQSIRIREKNQTELRMKIGAINCQIDTLKPVQTPSEDR